MHLDPLCDAVVREMDFDRPGAHPEAERLEEPLEDGLNLLLTGAHRFAPSRMPFTRCPSAWQKTSSVCSVCAIAAHRVMCPTA